MAPKIRLEVIDDEAQHFIVYFEGPGRIEIAPVPGGGRLSRTSIEAQK